MVISQRAAAAQNHTMRQTASKQLEAPAPISTHDSVCSVHSMHTTLSVCREKRVSRHAQRTTHNNCKHTPTCMTLSTSPTMKLSLAALMRFTTNSTLRHLRRHQQQSTLSAHTYRRPGASAWAP